MVVVARGKSTGLSATLSAFSPYGKKRMREPEERARRAASRLEGAGNGVDGAARRYSERESRSEEGRKEVESTKERRAWRRPLVVEASVRGEGKGKGRESSGVRDGAGEKRRGPREAAADGAKDGGAKTEETGKTKRQSSDRFMEGTRRRRPCRRRSRVQWVGTTGRC